MLFVVLFTLTILSPQLGQAAAVYDIEVWQDGQRI
jgi:hypothetical protein